MNKKMTAAMLNPEAGDHPVPEDDHEIQAAVTAAKKCRDEFPYFDERFQERGKNFAKSDSAWLVTLADLPADQMYSQVEWLGRVLSNRGCPESPWNVTLSCYMRNCALFYPKREKNTGASLRLLKA
jgi:hypothetical protein